MNLGTGHDGNAFFLGGGWSCGLFADAADTLILANQFLARRRGGLLKPETCELFRMNMTEGLNEARSVAWQLAATKDSHRRSLSAYLIASVTRDSRAPLVGSILNNERVFILLTNRHAHALPFYEHQSVRRQFHTLAVQAFDRN